MPESETRFFQACRGVFEGGGCRGAAHVGAYDAAVRCGIYFSEVAGTSAGSVIAALIGAGASPEFMLEKCARKNFSEFLAPPKGRINTFAGSSLGGVLTAPFNRLLSPRQQLIRRILLRGAAYSSDRLQSWVDDLLGELLPEAPQPVKFRDLVLPTYILATDLASQRPKIWSTRDTPDALVSLAVRSSSSIPLFFEPVESGNNFFVDGGMLSNLPTFVFGNDAKSANSLGGRILAFRLVEDQNPDTEWNLGWLLPRLISTAIGGATAIQSHLVSNVSTVNIQTGRISGTNFELGDDDLDFLIESGRSATNEFVKNEHATLNDSIVTTSATSSQDELYDELVRAMATPGKRLIVSQQETRWFWRLFPVIAHWLFNNADVDVIVGPLSGDEADRARETQRREILRKIGARINERPSIELSCFLVTHIDDRHNALFLEKISQTEHAPYGVTYSGVYHRTLMKLTEDKLDEEITVPQIPRPNLSIRESDPAELVDLLKQGVMQYQSSNVQIRLDEISINEAQAPTTKPIVRRVRSFKFRQIGLLCKLYNDHSIPMFKPADIYANEERVSTITPPVLERWGNDLVAVEGNTRIYHLHRGNVNQAFAFIVDGVTHPLPGTPSTLSRVLLATNDIPSTERIENFNYSRFRSIEGATRPVND